MKYYEFVSDSKTKRYLTREKATQHLESVLHSQVEKIIKRDRNHNIEYICGNGDRFIIRRVIRQNGLCH